MEELADETLRRVVRIITAGPSGSQQGSGFLVSGNEVLTAAHVVDGASLADVSLSSQKWSGNRSAAAVVRAVDPALDLALITLNGQAGTEADRIRLVSPNDALMHVGDEIAFAGFSTIDRDMQLRCSHIGAFDGVANAFIADGTAPEGFSGAPVFVDDQFAGIVFARIFEQAETYFYGHGEVATFLQQAAREPFPWSGQAGGALRRYPLGPAVPGATTLSRAVRMIGAYVELYPQLRAHDAVSRANAARLECGPPTGHLGIINVTGLPHPLLDTHSFWMSAFSEAGLKSPRMLAALLMLAEEAQLTAPQNAERKAFLNLLEEWH